MKRIVTVALFASSIVFALVPVTFAQGGEICTVPLAAMNPSGQIILGITPENILIKGVNATVRSIVLDSAPRHIILLLDISGSMMRPVEDENGQRWSYAKEMAETFLKDTPSEDFVALHVFARREAQIVPFTHDFASIRSAIDALPDPDSKSARNAYQSTTGAGDALHTILLDKTQNLGFGAAIILFSDAVFGEQDQTGRDITSVKREIAGRDVRAFLALALKIGHRWNIEPPDDFTVSSVSDSFSFMEETGGFSFVPAMFPPSPPLPVYRIDPLDKRMSSLIGAIHRVYRVQLQLNKPLRKREKLQLGLMGRDGKVLRNAFLFYPRDLYPDSARTP